MLLLLWGTVSEAVVAAPSIQLTMLATGNAVAQATPSITLSMLASTSAQFGSQATPSITLSLAVYAIGGHTLAGSTVLVLEYNA